MRILAGILDEFHVWVIPFADVVESVDTRDFSHDLSAPGETSGVELLKFGEAEGHNRKTSGNPEAIRYS